jgi:hypothetical protein
MKTTVILVLTGALIGAAVASWVVPPALAWYTTPGGLPRGAEVQAVVQISEVIRYSTSRLIRGQLIGAAAGAALGLAVGVFLDFRHRRGVPARPRRRPDHPHSLSARTPAVRRRHHLTLEWNGTRRQSDV